MRIDDKLYKRDTGNLYDDPEDIHDLVKTDNLYDDPEDLHDLMTTGFCHDCSVPYGNTHHVGCDIERCPICRDQFISCDHNNIF
jgi:hypothetical protein